MINFSNIGYLPIDIPKLQNKDKILNNLQELNDSIVGDNIWNSFNLLEGYSGHNHQYTCQWAESAIKNIPSLIEFIENNIPFTGFRMARLYRQIVEVDCHIDAVRDPETSICGDSSKTSLNYLDYVKQYEPLGYKLLINGTRDNHFYIAKKEARITKEEDRHYARLPESTDCFVIPYSTQAHGAIMEETDRLILIMHGYVDPSKHEELLIKSYDKYKDYVIWRSNL